MEESSILIINYLQSFIGWASRGLSRILSPTVKFANVTNMIPLPLWDCCSHYRFPNRIGRMFPWILLKANQDLRGEMLSWLWWTNCPNTLISYPYHTHSQLLKWLNYSSHRSYGYMGCPTVLFQIKTKYS